MIDGREGGRSDHDDYREELDDAIDAGGCTEAWEALSERRAEGTEADAPAELDVEAALLDAGCLRSTEGDELELDPELRSEWRTAIENVDSDELPSEVATAFDLEGDVEITETERAVQARADGRILAEWVSRPAMEADIAAGTVLDDREDGWEQLSGAQRGRLAGGLRLYLDFCPDCGGETSFDTERALSCCNEYQVATVSCEGCGVTVFEIPVEAARP